MADIKTREVVKGTVKSIDTVTDASERMKNVYIRTRVGIEDGNCSDKESEQYAADDISEMAERVAACATGQLKIRTHKRVERLTEQLGNGKTVAEKCSREHYVRKLKEEVRKTRTRENNQIRIRKVADTEQRINRSSGKAVKTAGKETASMESTAYDAFQKSVTVKRTNDDVRIGVKKIAKATMNAAKAVFNRTKEVIVAITAGGWIAVVVIVLVVMSALLLSSCFGIFFAGEDTGTGMTLQSVIEDIEEEYQKRVEEIMKESAHDEVEIEGTFADWKEMLAIYAVMITTDSERVMDVVEMDHARKEILRDIFWQMNALSYHTEDKTETEDKNGNEVKRENDISRIYLYINIESKTLEEMVEIYELNKMQKKLLVELIADDKSVLWNIVINYQ